MTIRNKQKTRKIIIFGTGEYGELAHYYFTHDSEYDVVAFTADDEFVKNNVFKGLPLINLSDLSEKYPPDQYEAHVALSFKKLNQTRAEKYYVLKKMGYKLVSYVCSKSAYWHDLSIGDNCFILENQTIQPTVKIGSNVMIWSGNHLGHRGIIGDHTYISSHVCIAGFVTIGTHSFLGINSTIRDFIKIGNRVFIGMGASVVQDVPDDSVVVGTRGQIYSAESETAIALKKKFMDL
jgi:sugar O-acyltransferase (sialic acid O-acetyltransferase NeuD family)